jgi:hypothetical protein
LFLRKGINQCQIELSLADSTNGTCAFASAAIDASICVDLVLSVALGNSLNGAGSSASAAADASIINNTCHFNVLLSKYKAIILLADQG